MAILAALFAILFGKLLGRWRGALAAVLGIAFYTVLVGMNAAVARAAILGILAVQIRRRQMALNSLMFAATPEEYYLPHTYLDGWIHLTSDDKQQ